ncbi:hypothetical protein [Actinacidiphila alni]|uniref:hypothetical protein n=1 Tax=Actinacidiphila alni TaxID=380248 RepID=UPI0034512AD1
MTLAIFALSAIDIGTARAADTPTVKASAAPCASMRQLGSTSYLHADGQIAASVKQFYGCGGNYGYIWVWESFRDSHHYYWTSLEVGLYARGRSAPYGYLKMSPAYSVEEYTPFAGTAQLCTHARATMLNTSPPWLGSATTEIVC